MSSQRSNWREQLRANPSRMEQELAINLEHDRITCVYLTIAVLLLHCLIGGGRDPWGPFSQHGLGDAGLGQAVSGLSC